MKAAGDAAAGGAASLSAGVSGALWGLTDATSGLTEAGGDLVGAQGLPPCPRRTPCHTCCRC